jgi:hypothetical protein
MSDDDLLTTAQVAKILGVHPGTVTNWRAWGLGPKFVRTGRSVRYKRGVIVDYKMWMAR